jgi:hypothetical protein
MPTTERPPTDGGTTRRGDSQRTAVAPPRDVRAELVPVAMSALAMFLVVAALLTVQMRLGRDPALRGRTVALARPAARPVLVRRILERRVIIDVIPATQAGAGPRPDVSKAPATMAPRVAPAPRYAPASPPAPAIVTRAS